MYTFRLYYSVSGSNRRRSIVIEVKDDILAAAWRRALDFAILIAKSDEVLNSIQIIERRE